MHAAMIVAAGGSSRRFGSGDKLGQDLGGRPLLVRTVESLSKHDAVREIIVAGPAEGFDEFRDRYGPTLGFLGARVVAGGAERWASVRNAVGEVSGDATHIAVHDAARPNLRPRLLDRLFDAAANHDAVIPVTPVADTIKRVSETTTAIESDDDLLADSILGDVGKDALTVRTVEGTIPRTGLVLVQTPQVFRAALLREVYAGDIPGDVTDDAMLVEHAGAAVVAIDGDPLNIKITTPDDLDLMRAILRVEPPKERPTHLKF